MSATWPRQAADSCQSRRLNIFPSLHRLNVQKFLSQPQPLNLGRGLRTLFGEGAGSPSNTNSPGWGLPPYRVASWCIQPFGHNRNGQKIGRRLRPLCWEGRLGLNLTRSPLSWGQHPYQVAFWCIKPFGHNRNGPKIGERGSALFFWGGEETGSPSNTKSPGLRPSSIPSDILINAAIWPQQIWAENWGGCATLREGELGPHLTQCGQGRGLSARQVSSWSIQPFCYSTPPLQRDRQKRQTTVW